MKGALEIPHDLVNEIVVLAAAIGDGDVRRRLTSRLRSDLFQGEGHAAIWGSLGELTRRGLDYDSATVRQLSGTAVEESYLHKIAAAHPAAPPNLGHHVSMLEWDAARVNAAKGPLPMLLKALQDPASPPETVRALAGQLATSFDGHGDRRHLREPNALVREAMYEIEQRRKVRASYPYGIDGLDYDVAQEKWRLVPGAMPGKMTVITAIPGAGKSTLAARMALGLARQRRRVIYGAWEMGCSTTLELLAAMSLGLSRYKLSIGDVSDEEMEVIRACMDKISAWVRFVEMPFGKVRGERHTNDAALDLIHGYIADSAADVAIFDLWKRCLRQTDPDDEEQALIRQQAIAAETKCHCILVQQQRSKDVELRPDKRPTREGIKGSGAWTEVADTILGVHRPGLWKAIDDTSVEVDVLKQRYGKWPMAVEFDWDPDLGSFANGRETEYDPPGAAGASSEVAEFLSGKGGRRGKRG